MEEKRKIYFQKFTKNCKLGISIQGFPKYFKNLNKCGHRYTTGIRTWKDNINSVIAFVLCNKRLILYFPLIKFNKRNNG